jgi:hypothetical protein
MLGVVSTTAEAQCEAGYIRRLGPSVEQATWPRTVLSPNITYDPVDGRVVLVGLSPEEDRMETWVWDGYAWERSIPSDGIEPPPVRNPAVSYHDGSGRVVMFGGMLTSGQPSGETWVWDGYFWSQPTYRDQPPTPRTLAGITYVPAGDQLILMGGLDAQGNPLAGVWSWATTSDDRPGGWIELLPQGDPLPPRAARNATVFDGATQTLYYVDPDNISGQYRWNPSPAPHGTITNISPQPAPGVAYQSCPLVFDGRAGELVRFVTDENETRKWVRGDQWLNSGGAGNALPTPLYDLSVTFDSRLKRVLIVGREFPHDDLQLWEYSSSPDAAAPIAGPIMLESDITSVATAQVRGEGPFEYRWYFEGQPIVDDSAFEGSRSRSLAIATRNARCYVGELTVAVTSPCGTSISPPLTLLPPSVADFNIDGGVDGADVQSFYELFAVGEPAADVNCDGGVDGADVETFFICWMSNCD